MGQNAASVRFELTIGGVTPVTAYKAVPINHSGNSPVIFKAGSDHPAFYFSAIAKTFGPTNLNLESRLKATLTEEGWLISFPPPVSMRKISFT